MKDFVAIDFETADERNICAVGIVVIENNEIIDTYQTLIRPPGNRHNYYASQVHGLYPEDTMHSPSFLEIYPEIKKRLKNRYIVAHNESFDRSVFKKALIDNGLDYSELNIAEKWECTMKTAKKLVPTTPRLKSAKLNDCCRYYRISLNHHEALSDALGCAKLYIALNS